MTALTSRIACTVLLGLTAAAFAAPVAEARMTPQQCYQRDSNCTQFCGDVKDSEWRHECFMRCNKYLDNCLSKGVWTDQGAMADPGSDPTTPPKGPKGGVIKVPAGLLDASPGLPTQGPAGTGTPAGGGAATTGPVLR